MAKSSVRLKYSGLVVFGSYLVSAATGFAFMLMIARSVSTNEFGIWGNINDLFSYFILFASVLPFWTTRFVARKHSGSARTGLFANILISIAVASIYLAFLPIILSALRITSAYRILYIVLSIQIVEPYTINALQAVLQAKQPQTIGYGLLVYEACRIVLAFILIIHFKLGLLGAICSVIVSYLTQIMFYVKLIAKEFKESVRWSYLKEWLKASSINVYNAVGSSIAAFPLIFLFVYGGELARAYYAAAVTISTVIFYSSFLAFALYPRLLSGSSPEDVSISLKMVMMFAIPMTVGDIVLSDSYLAILKFIYVEARTVLVLLAIGELCTSITGVFGAIISGTERIDAKEKIPFWELVKSRLFLFFTLSYIQSAVTIPATFIILTSIAKTPLEAATYVALITFLASLAMLIATYALARRCLVFSLPWNSVLKYVLASTVMAAVLLVIPHSTKLSITIAFTLLGAAIYLAVLTLIDKETKSLLNSIIQEIMRIIKVKKPQTNVSGD
jgi:O-antigen/teichoic acid export membrane protein